MLTMTILSKHLPPISPITTVGLPMPKDVDSPSNRIAVHELEAKTSQGDSEHSPTSDLSDGSAQTTFFSCNKSEASIPSADVSVSVPSADVNANATPVKSCGPANDTASRRSCSTKSVAFDNDCHSPQMEAVAAFSRYTETDIEIGGIDDNEEEEDPAGKKKKMPFSKSLVSLRFHKEWKAFCFRTSNTVIIGVFVCMLVWIVFNSKFMSMSKKSMELEGSGADHLIDNANIRSKHGD